MNLVKVSNIYGYPALSKGFIKWAERMNVDVVVSVHNVEKFQRTKEFLIVIAGLPFLESAKVPIIGYVRNGAAIYNRSNMPTKLKPNETTLHIPKFNEQPSSESLYQFYTTEVIPEDWPKRYVNMHETVCLNERVFSNKQKDIKVLKDEF
jgi:hypothetical protein